MNLFWIMFNIVVLGVATAVAYEAQQRRTTVRVQTVIPSIVRFPDGTEIPGETVDVSAGGVAVRLLESINPQIGEGVRVLFPLRIGDASLPASIVRMDGRTVRLKYDSLTISEQEMLTMVLYSRADNWLGWGEAREADQPLRSLGRIVQISYRGLSQTIRGVGSRRRRSNNMRPVRTAGAIALAFLLLGATTLRAEAPADPAAPHPSPRCR